MGGLPLSWSELSPEDRARVQDNFYEKSALRDLVRYENGVVMPSFIEKPLIFTLNPNTLFMD